MKIVVISPTYNEKVNMEKMIPLLEEVVFPKIKNHQMHILIADDSSPDGTADTVRGFMKKWKNIDLLMGEKKGLGAAYAKAMKYAMHEMKADVVIEFDADFQHDPHDIPRLIAAMDEGADHVIGSRYVPGGKIPSEWGLHRKILSVFGSLFARVVLFMPHIHDMTSGFKLTKTDYLKKVDLDHLFSYYFAYKIHILHDVVRLGATVKEVPIIFYEREEGSSKISRKDLFDSFYVVLKLRLKDSKRVVKFLIVGGTGFIVQVIVQEGSIFLGLTKALAFSTAFTAGLISIRVTDMVALSHAFGAMLGAEAAILSNFMFNHFWTFQDTHAIKQNSSFIVKLLKFNTASFGSIFVQFSSVWIFEKLLGPMVTLGTFTIPTRLVVVVPTIILIVIPMNYLIYNKVIWKTQYLHNGKNKKA